MEVRSPACVQDEPIVLNRKRKQGGHGSRDFNLDFEFGERDGSAVDDDWLPADVRKQLKIKVVLPVEGRSFWCCCPLLDGWC